jgi:DNA-binding CsgD family transcriptional regulator
LALLVAIANTFTRGDTKGAPSQPGSFSGLQTRIDLSRRKREVLALLCQRLTDPEMADEHFISSYTANKRVSNVLGKIGVANRRQAATITVITWASSRPCSRTGDRHMEKAIASRQPHTAATPAGAQKRGVRAGQACFCV